MYGKCRQNTVFQLKNAGNLQARFPRKSYKNAGYFAISGVLAPRTGFEPAACRLGGDRSIHLSYRGLFTCMRLICGFEEAFLLPLKGRSLYPSELSWLIQSIVPYHPINEQIWKLHKIVRVWKTHRMGQNKNDLSSIQEQSTSVFVHIINLLIYSIIADYHCG